jgi:WD40 repeat protein
MRTFAGHKTYVNQAVFSPDGRYILTGSSDMTAKLWLTSTGEELRTYGGHADEVFCVAFSPDGRHILTGSYDGTVRMWDVDVQDSIRTVCRRLVRDLTEDERVQYGIADETPTCPNVHHP